VCGLTGALRGFPVPGGPPVAKILVADDNSNIQKMVGLALKDQGIDVVAVGNGEAAVRKISDIKPDLVLADVFMPVRNGYEVCQYVKADPALAHIPVILLVGAFDPLDEQEAQRVGADGVLKKPFVPPDPLISMVKSALARAGVPLGNEPEVVATVKEEAPAFKPLALQMAPPPPAFDEPAIDDIPARPAPINIDRGAQPVAFGSLLETAEDDTAQLVAPVRMERDWKSADAEEEKEIAEEEEEHEHGWRPAGTDSDVDDVPAGKKDWREVAFANIPDAPARNSYSVVEEVPPELVTADAAPDELPSAYAAEATWSVAIGKPEEEEVPHAAEAEREEPVPSPEAIAMPDLISVQESAPVPNLAPATEAATNNTWMSAPPSPWDAEVAKASKLAATWDTSVAVATEPVPATLEVHEAAPAVAPEAVAEVERTAISNSLPAAAEEVIREEAVHVVEESAPEASHSPSVAEVPVTPAPSVDDMVAKVLAKMDPSVLQAMTRELLKPVIESIVREELNKK
jgi:CheY-like chemotaxis protein